ncbi:MAG: hypothetical protein R8K21_04380 [Mariprofundales bacterium]
MSQQNIAIIGLGRVGTEFLREMLNHKSQGFNIACVAEVGDTPGKAKAEDVGIKVLKLQDIIRMGTEVDVIFDFTGSRSIRKVMRQMLEQTQNTHSVIASDSISKIIWSLLTDKSLPDEMVG